MAGRSSSTGEVQRARRVDVRAVRVSQKSGRVGEMDFQGISKGFEAMQDEGSY